MLKVLSAVAMLALASGAELLPRIAHAEGALAAGIPASIVKDGTAYGISQNQPTQDAAGKTAIQACLTMPNSGAPARKLCKVISYFRNQCAAVAEDPQAGTPGYGWAIAGDLQTAQNQAMAKCHATAGESRRQYCGVAVYGCDGSAH